MASYTAADRHDRWKAIAGVVAVHVGLGAVIVAGLNVPMVSRAVEQLKTFDIRQPPPPPVPPPLVPNPRPARKPERTPAKKAEPTPVVGPPSPARSPIPAAKVAGIGSAAASGAATAGNGTGASGSGVGGGAPDYSRFTPARLVRNLTRSDYGSIAAGRLLSGRAMVSLRIEPSGGASNCRIVRSSGDSAVDGALCPLIEQRLRFRPALDDRGQPIPYQLQYVATWSL